MGDGALRKGDLVEVRSAAEILATLDDGGALDALPFMPEMIYAIGRRFTVDKRVERVCDTVNTTLRSRAFANAVFLAGDERCDGAAHGGCQADCRVVWREAWLRKVDAGTPPAVYRDDEAALAALRERLEANVHRPSPDDVPRWRCQTTDLALASTHEQSNLDPRPLVRELTCGNIPLKTWGRVAVRAAVWQPAHKMGKAPWPRGTNVKSPKGEPLNLQPGDWVRVKPIEAIKATLTPGGANRGLHFDTEMAGMCGQVFRVKQRVSHIIEEPTGKMLTFGSDCIKLEGAYCSGERSTGRWFCAREIYPYFREIWLERADAPAGA